MPLLETLLAITYEFGLRPKCDYCGQKHGRKTWQVDGKKGKYLRFMSKKCAMNWLRENEIAALPTLLPNIPFQAGRTSQVSKRRLKEI